jgi:hypothetical protein
MLVLCVSTLSAQPRLPDTPAGRTFGAWLAALNSGDRDQIAAYVQKYDPNGKVEGIMRLRAMSGGFDLQQIVESQRVHLEVLLAGHTGPRVTLVEFDVTDADPARVTRFRPHPLLPGQSTVGIDTKIDAATRARVIDSAIVDLDAVYVTPAVGKRMANALRAHQKHGDYDTVTDGDAFADRLTSHLQDVSHDKHLHVMFSPAPLPPNFLAPDDTSHGEPPEVRRRMEQNNCAFEKAEILLGNIGYLKFNAFDPPEVCAPTATAAMNFLANTDAIIFDLRQNNGGDPDMVQFIASYLFDHPTHLSDIWTRKDSSTQQYWTLPYVPGKSLAGKPAYVLTSKQTFSAGEAFTYDLKNLKRATIVGETTGGGAHAGDARRIDDRFVFAVPSATAISPITHTNWEGTGVEPDVKVSADSALARAAKLAADTLARLPK